MGATREAARGLLGAHIELGKAELADILDEVKRVALYAGVAIGALVVVGFLLPIGLFLFLGEWLFGSLGWGVLHGSLFLVGIALTAVLAALGVRRAPLALALLVAIAVGIAVGVGLVQLGMERPAAAGVGVAIGLFAWPIVAGIAAFRTGIDTEALVARFKPGATIETTKETIEWVRAQTPLGRKS